MWCSTRLLSRPFPVALSVSETLAATSYVHQGRSTWIWPLPGSSRSTSRSTWNFDSKLLTLSITSIRALEALAQRRGSTRPTLVDRVARPRPASFPAHLTRGFYNLDSKYIGRAVDLKNFADFRACYQLLEFSFCMRPGKPGPPP